MQLTYVFSELGNGLKRNVSMTIAVIVTIFVSLTLVGMGLLLNAQAQKAHRQAPDPHQQGRPRDARAGRPGGQGQPDARRALRR